MDICLPCFPSSGDGGDREPLLRSQYEPQHPAPPISPPPRQPLSKLADILGALSAGKLPSQMQINRFLRYILRLDLFSSRDPQSAATPEVLRGDGPLSTRGREVIQDLKEVVQALLQFGMEKNDDDRLQGLLFQIAQIDLEEHPVRLEAPEASGSGSKMREEVDRTKENAKKLGRSEVAADAKMMVRALKSLCFTFLTSSVFRLILSDAISIGRDLVAHAASDTSSPAVRVRDFVENIEKQAETADLWIGPDPQQGIGLRQAAGEPAEASKADASATVRGAQQPMEGKKQECKERVVETGEEVKRKLLARVQEVVVRAREDPSSRRAILAILQIIRKYAHKFVLASHETATSIQEAIKGEAEARSSSSREKYTNSQQGIPMGFSDSSSYPPQPYPTEPVPKILIPGIEIDSPHLQRVLRDAKLMIERIAQGHRIDDMLKTLGDIIKHAVAAPRDVGEIVEKLVHEKFQSGDEEPSGVGATQRTGRTDHSANEFGESPRPSATGAKGHDGEDTRTAFAMYFSSIGAYLDKALNESGWATSKRGQKALDTLYDATQDLLHIAGDVIETAEVTGERIEEAKGVGQAKEKMKSDREGQMQGQSEVGDITQTEEVAEDEHKITTRWVDDIVKLLDQAGDYIDAAQQDKATMRLIHALENLQKDVEDLFSVGRQEMNKAAEQLGSGTQKRAYSFGRLGLHTQWAAWALPRLLQLFPLEAIPVPRVEFKSGRVEGVFDAFWVRGATMRNETVGGRYMSVSDPRSIVPGTSRRGEAAARGSRVREYDEGGIGGKLIPDEILMRQWTEARVVFAGGRRAEGFGAGDARSRMGLLGGTRRRNTPGIESVSRLRIRMDGIKALIREMGYYFRYNDSVFNYEDEGILSVDIGTVGGRRSGRSGFGLDVELEVDSGDAEMDLLAARATPAIPVLIVEDVDAAGQWNVDILGSDGEVNALPIGRLRIPIKVALANVAPLFRVIGVRVDIRGIEFRMDRSRHYILNKSVVEPFGATIVGDIAKSVLEERIHKALEAASRCMALVLKEAKERAINRRTEITEGTRERSTTAEAEADGETRVIDVFAVLLERGPEILAYYAGSPDQQEQSGRIKTDTNLTGKGGTGYSKQTHVQVRQPVARSSMVIPPAYSTDNEGTVGDVRVLREGEGTRSITTGEGTDGAAEEETEDAAIAGGTGPLERGGPHDVPKNAKTAKPGLMEEIDETRQRHHDIKGKGKQKTITREEEVGGWRSLAFDW